MDLKEMMDLNPPPKSSSQTDIVDTLVSVEDEIVNVEAEESPLEMWKSHVFFDQDTFKKILGKFAVQQFCLQAY